jgi:uncharacterized membrane protein
VNMKKILRPIIYFIILIAPIVLWLLPASFFDDTGVVTCPSVAFFNVECIGCGMTRAVLHFHHFEYTEAMFYNYGIVVVYPLLALVWLRLFIVALKEYGVIKGFRNVE